MTRIRIITEHRVGQLDTGDIAIMSGRGDVKCAVRCEDTKIDRKQNQVHQSTRRHHSLLCRAGWSGRGLAVVRNATLNFPVFIQPGSGTRPVQAVSSQGPALADPVLGVLQSHI